MAEKGSLPAGTDNAVHGVPRHRAPSSGRGQLRDGLGEEGPAHLLDDFDYWNERMRTEDGRWLTRGELTIEFLRTWKAAGIPPADTLRAITINGYKAADIIADRGPIKPGCSPT